MNKTFWKDYWDKQINGQHRSQQEDFLEKESKEKLLHLNFGEKLLDFGCGSADLLLYYIPHYKFCVGADNSKLMLEKAEERLKAFQKRDKVLLIHSDNQQVWNDIENKLGKDCKFDCITAGQVMQYLNKPQIADFVCNAASHLTANGKTCLFDIVDSRTYELRKAGLFNANSFNFYIVIMLIFNRLRTFVKKLIGKPSCGIGYAYPPSFFVKLAPKNNLTVSCINSMYYEYRFHIILTANY
jgi:cyclopropane fatty-acyl-phospholipid synthase-like methyltransferase